MEISEYKRCNNGHLMFEDENFCIICGNEVEEYWPSGKNNRKCCGHKHKKNWKFCPYTGNEIITIIKE